jgi:hypothetical protein
MQHSTASRAVPHVRVSRTQNVSCGRSAHMPLLEGVTHALHPSEGLDKGHTSILQPGWKLCTYTCISLSNRRSDGCIAAAMASWRYPEAHAHRSRKPVQARPTGLEAVEQRVATLACTLARNQEDHLPSPWLWGRRTLPIGSRQSQNA